MAKIVSMQFARIFSHDYASGTPGTLVSNSSAAQASVGFHDLEKNISIVGFQNHSLLIQTFFHAIIGGIGRQLNTNEVS